MFTLDSFSNIIKIVIVAVISILLLNGIQLTLSCGSSSNNYQQLITSYPNSTIQIQTGFYVPQTDRIYMPGSVGPPANVTIFNPDHGNLTNISGLNDTTVYVASGTYDPDNHLLYFLESTNQSSSYLSIVDPNTNSQVSEISLDNSNPISGVLNYVNNNKLYIPNQDTNTLTVFNTTSNTNISAININGPVYSVYDPNNKYDYVTFQAAPPVEKIAIIDTVNDTWIGNLTGTITSTETGIAFDPIQNELYATAGTQIDVFDTSTNTFKTSITQGLDSPTYLAYNSNDGLIYTQNLGISTLFQAIDPVTNQVVNSASGTFLTPEFVVFDSANGNLYYADAGASSLETSLYEYGGTPGQSTAFSGACNSFLNNAAVLYFMGAILLLFTLIPFIRRIKTVINF